MLTPFTERMKSYWTETLGLTDSNALEEGWQQLAQAISGCDRNTLRWQVIQQPTGSGKTQALKVLCSIQDQIQHPGVLIVTKFREEANRLSEGINELARWKMARPFHQEASATNDQLAFAPVVVTTHASYRLALKEIADTGLNHKANRLLSYECGKRDWVVIDEAFDWADNYSLSASNLRSMSGDLARAMHGELRAAAEQLFTFSIRLTDTDLGRSDRVLDAECFDILASIDLSGLRAGIAGTSDDAFAKLNEHRPATKSEPASRIERSSKPQYLEQLDQLQTIARIGHAWTSRRGGRTQLHSARSLIGVDGMRGVILDATAGIDPVYSIMRQHVDVLARPPGIRTYRNVTLHVSYGHKVGKEHLAKHAGKEWSTVWGDLSERLSGKRILVCAHKDARPSIEPYGPKDGSVQFDNWGNLDGRNDWNSCEAAILFGLPYLDDIEPAQRFIAHQGRQSDEWFLGSRKYKDYADIRTALSDGFIARSVVQAINRIQCRNAIDADGNCKPTDIYLLLPRGNTGAAVVRAIQDQMPGIRLASWPSKATKRKARKIPTEIKLADHFESADPGYYSKSEIVNTLRINPSSLERITAKLRQQQSGLAKKLEAYGVHYHSQTGRGKEAYFIKQ
ncbi:DEAD/DEAH box helicase family protein [Mesorhizobium sp. M0715]|uniref:DEAD/DEAH box helicase family protein n=1 Tax=Mesorhizobium sp. M0715 TaxID=2956990 RepID=UPI00333B3116